jgi:mRNA-degrading endonuclease toxin of MazEF toxin-antitoxin module
VLPITTSTHVFPFDVALDNRTQTKGHILSRRIRALDLDNRMAYKIERAPDDIVNQRIRNIELMIEKE